MLNGRPILIQLLLTLMEVPLQPLQNLLPMPLLMAHYQLLQERAILSQDGILHHQVAVKLLLPQLFLSLRLRHYMHIGQQILIQLLLTLMVELLLPPLK